ncbi:unnamed protein product, partial [Meganyctiphanes norvegica]
HCSPDIAVMKLLVIVLLATLLVIAESAITCYDCVNNPTAFSWLAQDSECANASYSGDTKFWSDADSCRMAIYTDGTVQRGGAWNHADGECYPGADHLTCYCTGDLCNDNLCDFCNTARDNSAAWWRLGY